MKKTPLCSLLIAFVLFFTIGGSALAQLPPGWASIQLVKNGELMKVNYELAATKTAAEMVTRFKNRLGWHEPGDEECIPIHADVLVEVQVKSVRAFFYSNDRLGLRDSTPPLPTYFPAWRIADTVMVQAAKFLKKSKSVSLKP